MTDPERFHSPEDVAELLGLHVRTVRRYIREGKLDAVRIGNRYRIAPEDLEAFAGRPADGPGSTTPNGPPRTDVTCVIDIQPIDRDGADRITTLLTASAMGRERGAGTRLRLDAIQEPDHHRLKVVVVGPPADTAAVLALLAAYQDR
ncbi:helix-turn-helix domain-containing protein [Euzebya sp.]|uniref:helix-turn-helix domain-containing protein n=1 Tax=Euzebya sp. TaxID=1971409 RepID=UPI0035114603